MQPEVDLIKCITTNSDTCKIWKYYGYDINETDLIYPDMIDLESEYSKQIHFPLTI